MTIWPSQKAIPGLKLTPQELHLYQHHIDNLNNNKFVRNKDGSISTLYQTDVEIDGRTYNVPTVWDGKILPPHEAIQRAFSEKGKDYWPSYPSQQEAETRYGQMHDALAPDVEQLAQPQSGARNNMGFFDDIARRMAEWGVTPEAITPIISQHMGSLMQPITTNESFPNARAGIAQFGKDLMEPIPTNSSFTPPKSAGMSMTGVPRSPGPAQSANPPPAPNNFSFGGLLHDLFAPMPTNSSFQDRPIMPATAPGAPMAPEQGPPMSAMMDPMQGPPNLGNLMQPQTPASTFPMRPEGQPTGQTVGHPFADFMETVRQGGLTNNYGLAAVAATGTRESGWNQKRIAGTWSDPSQSGQPGTSGGALSWRGPRYQNMINFAQQNGLDPHQASTQAKFFMQEDPNLIAKLNAAQSPQEAQAAMNNAWAFAGFDDPNNNETKARFQKANDFSGAFAGGIGSWTDAMAKAGVKTTSSGNVDSPVKTDTETTPTSTSGSPVVAPASATSTFGSRFGEMMKGIKAPESKKPPPGQAPAPQQGSFRPDPQSLQLIMAMLGAGGGGAAVPTLTDLMNGGGRR